jgi:hypothetical protein
MPPVRSLAYWAQGRSRAHPVMRHMQGGLAIGGMNKRKLP